MNKTYKDSYYTSGEYLSKSIGAQDAESKIEWIADFINPYLNEIGRVRKIADVGCGSGRTTEQLHKLFISTGFSDVETTGFDVHPHMVDLESRVGIEFVQGDFLAIANEIYDVIFLLDVVEHLLEPIDFLSQTAERAKWFVLHVPLDNSILTWMRNLPRDNLTHPGHLLNLDMASAINLITYSGLKLIDYKFTPVFRAPSGRISSAQKLINPLRSLGFRISPYLLQKTLGGVSTLILARSVKTT